MPIAYGCLIHVTRHGAHIAALVRNGGGFGGSGRLRDDDAVVSCACESEGGASRDGESSTSFPRPRGLAAGVSRKRQKESRAFRDIVVASTSFFEKQTTSRVASSHGARPSALGAGKASPAVLGSAENCDPQTSTSAPARGSEKPERPPQPTCSRCYRRFKTAEQLTARVAKASHSRHDPRCGACGKHFANLDTLRQHLAGQLPNKACAARFRASGCPLCLAHTACRAMVGARVPEKSDAGAETARRRRQRRSGA